MSVRSSPQTPLGSLQRSPDPLAGFKGAALRQEIGWGEKGRTRGKEKGDNGPGREGKRGKLGNSALVVRG